MIYSLSPYMSHIALFILCHCYLGYPCLDLHRSPRPLFCIKLLGHPVSVGEGMCLVHCTVPAVDKDGADLLFSTPPSNHSNHSSSRKGSHSMEDADQLQCTFSTHTHSFSHTLTYTHSHIHTITLSYTLTSSPRKYHTSTPVSDGLSQKELLSQPSCMQTPVPLRHRDIAVTLQSRRESIPLLWSQRPPCFLP